MGDDARSYLELTDWRRRVAAMWEQWRNARTAPEGATEVFRESKDRLFRDHPQTPLPREVRAAFSGLAYWPYDEAFRMTVPLHAASSDAASADARPLALPSSGSDSIAFRRVGRVALSGPLTGHALSVFWIDAYGGGIFLPFRDATSGSETYGAGRYLLDTIKAADHGGDPSAGTIVLDFNMAFHPSCAYDPKWSCPLAPPENRLPVPIRVGERLPLP